jgi:hypothetical protein
MLAIWGHTLGATPIQKECVMKALIQRMLVSTAIAIVSLGCGGYAMAASPQHKANVNHKAGASAAQAPSRYQARPVDVAAIPPYPNYSSYAAPSPGGRAGYDIAANAPYPQWGRSYPILQWAPGYPVGGAGIDIGGLIAALSGSGFPLHYGSMVAASGSDSYDYSPAYDAAPADAGAADVGAAAEQAAADAVTAAEQQEATDLSALNASIAAAEEQNDEANAATEQYEINNGM